MSRNRDKELKEVLSKNTWLISQVEQKDRRIEDLEESVRAALAVLPRQKNPHLEDARQRLINLAGGLLESGLED
jgi:hypothetical protein